MNKEQKVKRLKDIVSNTRVCMFTTMVKDRKLRSRPMYTAQLDDDGTMWFFTDIDSGKVDEIFNFQPILITFSNEGNNSYLSISGYTTLENDSSKKEEIFNTITKAWYPEGPDSENLILIKFIPEEAELWDGTDSKILQAFKIGKALITGTKYDVDKEAYSSIDL